LYFKKPKSPEIIKYAFNCIKGFMWVSVMVSAIFIFTYVLKINENSPIYMLPILISTTLLVFHFLLATSLYKRLNK
jgi:hypothetical protein